MNESCHPYRVPWNGKRPSTLWGMSSRLRKTIAVPAFTVSSFGVKVKLSMFTSISAARTGNDEMASAASRRGASYYILPRNVPCQRFQLASSGVLVIARALLPCLTATLVIPSTVRSFSAGTSKGPGEGTVRGAGCGKAVDLAVWKVTWPSTFCIN